jgi:dTMP kinase
MFLPRDSAFICIEGLDAAGKNTQTKKLAARFDSIGSSAITFSFPRYATDVGKAILRHLKGEIVLVQEDMDAESNQRYTSTCEDALAFQCLMLADKADAAAEIANNLITGHVVICDRWWQSAYAFGGADGLDLGWLMRIHSSLPLPWLNVFIDVPPEEALRRRPEARDRYERDREKQKIVRANYEQLWTNAGPDYVKIDGVGTEDEVHARIWSALENRP